MLEETGWQAKDLVLLCINDSPKEDRQNVAFVYSCTAVKKIGESDEQRWFNLDKFSEDKEIAFDHAEDIELYRKY